MPRPSDAKISELNARLNDSDVERRMMPVRLTRADGGDGRTVRGEAAVFGQRYDMGWYEEEIAVGACDNALSESDVRALFNHDANLILGRTGAGTLTVAIEGDAMVYQFDAPTTTAGNDLLVSLERGDIAESSWAFTVKKQEWVEEEDEDGHWNYLRRITEVGVIYDVSPVTYPANPGTSVAKRSFETWKGAKVSQDKNKPLRTMNTPSSRTRLRHWQRRALLIGVK